MRDKLVLWGKAPDGKRSLLTLQLLPARNELLFRTYPEEVATEAFSRRLYDEWRLGKEMELPEEIPTLTLPLTATGSLLPEGYEVERQDLVQRAQTEWHFIVLSERMYATFLSEAEDLQERVEQLQAFDPGLWEELKGFWGKVQGMMRERNLYRDHGLAIKEKTNPLFDRMKDLRSQRDKKRQQESVGKKEEFLNAIRDIERRLEEGVRLRTLFEELKAVQHDMRKARLSRGHQKRVKEKLDKAFQLVKEKMYGPEAARKQGGALERLRHRYAGLLKAIDRQKYALRRDQKDRDFENRRVERTDGQLEAQLRQARIQVIEERIRSKEAKIAELEKVKEDLEKKLQREEERETRRKEAARKKEVARALKQEVDRKVRENQPPPASTTSRASLRGLMLAVSTAVSITRE